MFRLINLAVCRSRRSHVELLKPLIALLAIVNPIGAARTAHATS